MDYGILTGKKLIRESIFFLQREHLVNIWYYLESKEKFAKQRGKEFIAI